MAKFHIKEKYNLYDLVDIVKSLRSENGCPWDMVQTHESIRNNFLEEVYEVIEAIDLDNSDMLKEELGDVLLQIVFHTEMETEVNSFNIDDVANDICQKLVIRHPHVFGSINVKNTDEVLKNWEDIKQETKGQETYTDTLKSVPKVFPALMRAQKIGKRAKRAGMDFDSASDALKRLKSEISELEQALNNDDLDEISDELGDILFSCTNVARFLDLDAEEALQNSSDKFIRRFEKVEEQIKLDGIDMKSLGIDELDAYWHKAKRKN